MPVLQGLSPTQQTYLPPSSVTSARQALHVGQEPEGAPHRDAARQVTSALRALLMSLRSVARLERTVPTRGYLPLRSARCAQLGSSAEGEGHLLTVSVRKGTSAQNAPLSRGDTHAQGEPSTTGLG